MRTFENVGNEVTIQACQMYYALGFDCAWNDGRHLTIIEKEKELSDGHLKSSMYKENISNKSISNKTSAIKHNYSTVCRRCGRKLNSEESRNRGYGSYCYRKANTDLLKEVAENAAEDINFLNELRGIS